MIGCRHKFIFKFIYGDTLWLSHKPWASQSTATAAALTAQGVFVVKTAGPGGHLRDGPTRHGLGGRPGPVGVGCELDDESNCDDRRYS